jgi:hypothetical protein
MPIRHFDIHCNMSRVGLLAANTNAVPARPAGIKGRGVICTNNECIALSIGQVLGQGGRLVNIVSENKAKKKTISKTTEA